MMRGILTHIPTLCRPLSLSLSPSLPLSTRLFSISTVLTDRHNVLQSAAEMPHYGDIDREILHSANKDFGLYLETDGNLAIYNNRTKEKRWESGERRTPGLPYFLVMQSDNNLVVYSEEQKPSKCVWATETNYSKPEFRDRKLHGSAALTDDGHLVVYDGDDHVLWKKP
mmetsp:Transcript_25176/g.39265  ORF Transcript_25176/g.39265 Transcript_25176/m.39265 type:complete len:169 (-) Transcript_25176:133-639(-)